MRSRCARTARTLSTWVGNRHGRAPTEWTQRPSPTGCRCCRACLGRRTDQHRYDPGRGGRGGGAAGRVSSTTSQAGSRIEDGRGCGGRRVPWVLMHWRGHSVGCGISRTTTTSSPRSGMSCTSVRTRPSRPASIAQRSSWIRGWASPNERSTTGGCAPTSTTSSRWAFRCSSAPAGSRTLVCSWPVPTALPGRSRSARRRPWRRASSR